MGKKVLVTGAAGFIGFHLCLALLKSGLPVVGIDDLNPYYDPALKRARLDLLTAFDDFTFYETDISLTTTAETVFKNQLPELVVHLAAQAGVRHSISNPEAYIESNIVGFFNILEACRHYPVKHLVYASSSSVYGNQEKTPFSTEDRVDQPISLYAATKRSNELMAYTYSHLYQFPTTGLRFFTVYGPYGRPDMAYYSFTQKMIAGEAIRLFNHGDLKRDFTYIDDIVEGIVNVLKAPPASKESAKIYNIGNGKPQSLLHFVETLERCLHEEGLITIPVKKISTPMQPGDVYQTFADVSELMRDFDFAPATSLERGLRLFAHWYKTYHPRP